MPTAPAALLEAILEGARHPMLVLTREGIVLEANRAALDWLGAPRDAVVGRTLSRLNQWRGGEPVLAEGQEFQLKRGAFTLRWVASANLFLAEGYDLAAVEEERKHARLVFELANIGVWSWDLASDRVNNRSERGVFGWAPMVNATREQIIARFQPDDGAFLFAEADAAVASRSGFKVELRAMMPDSEELRWVSVTGTVRCDENGKPVRVDGITVDITERKLTELRLRESEARFRSIFENAGIGIALVSPDGVPVETNPALAHLLGYDSAQLLKMHFGEFTHKDDLTADMALYRDLMAGRRNRYDVEKRYLRKDGAVIWARLVVSAVRNPAGQVVFAIGMVEDITQRKRVEEEVMSLSEKLISTQERERSRIARELHDGLGQQLAALSISVAGLKRDIPEQDTETRERMARLQHRIGAIAEGVRRISHELHPAVLELAGVVPALRSYCDQFSADTGIAVSLEALGNFEGLPPNVALCLFRVAQEALQNVAKHSRANDALVQIEAADESVVLNVIDHGRGFDAESGLGHAGLGLVSMRERARLANGAMRISSVPGEGTTLRVQIPLEGKQAASTAAPAP